MSSPPGSLEFLPRRICPTGSADMLAAALVRNTDDEGENDRGLTARFKQVHAAELAVEPNFQILRRYRRPLLLRLDHAHRQVHHAPQLDSRRALNLRIGITQRSLRSGSAI